MNMEVEIGDADANNTRPGASRPPALLSIFSRFYKLVFLGPKEGSVKIVLKSSVIITYEKN